MMAPGKKTEQLAIQSMRKPCDGVPIASRKRCRRPTNVLPTQPGVHVRVVHYIKIVVVIDEGMAYDGGVHTQGCSHKKNANQNIPLLTRQRETGLMFPRLNRDRMRSGIEGLFARIRFDCFGCHNGPTAIWGGFV